MAKKTMRRYERMNEEEMKEAGLLTPSECMARGIPPLVNEYGMDPYLKTIDTIVEVEDGPNSP